MIKSYNIWTTEVARLWGAEDFAWDFCIMAACTYVLEIAECLLKSTKLLRLIITKLLTF